MVIGKHLVQRGKVGIWQLRVAVPRELQKALGQRERIKSLGTSDRVLAEQRALPILAEWRALWADLRCPSASALPHTSSPSVSRHAPTAIDMEDAATAAGYHLELQRADDDRRAFRGAGRPLWESLVQHHQTRLESLAQIAATGDLSASAELADEVIAVLGWDLPRESDSYSRFCQLLSEANLDAARVSARRNQGETDAEPASRVVRKALARDEARAANGQTIAELFERWAADRLAKGQKRADTVAQDRKAIEQFAEFVGKDRDVRSVTAIEVAEYRDVLRQLPPKWRANAKLKGLGMREAAARARELKLPESAFTSVNKHLSTISPLYKWLAGQPAWAGMRNPCDGLFHDKVKGKNRRPSFSTGQLNTILSSPLFTGFLAPGKEHQAGNLQADDWRKWIPLVALFTGARIGEVAQLRVGDVRQERGVWFIHIAHDEEAGLSTKSGKSRPAALHPMLAAIGFLVFHERQAKRTGGNHTAQLFPELAPNKRGQISGVPSRFWRDYLAAIGVKDGSDGFGAHSFRHTLADRLRSEVELLDPQIAIVLGHTQQSTTAGYGELSQGTVNMLKGWMDALRFDGVEFDHLQSPYPVER